MVKEKWLEILSITTTAVFSLIGALSVGRLTRYLTEHCFAWLGASPPVPTQYVIDLAYGGVSETIPLFVPILVALGGAKLKQRTSPLLGTTMLVMAPQLALIEVCLALLSLMLPLISISYAPR